MKTFQDCSPYYALITVNQTVQGPKAVQTVQRALNDSRRWGLIKWNDSSFKKTTKKQQQSLSFISSNGHLALFCDARSWLSCSNSFIKIFWTLNRLVPIEVLDAGLMDKSMWLNMQNVLLGYWSHCKSHSFITSTRKICLPSWGEQKFFTSGKCSSFSRSVVRFLFLCVKPFKWVFEVVNSRKRAALSCMRSVARNIPQPQFLFLLTAKCRERRLQDSHQQLNCLVL